jgi:alginate O-acetyltransferase complex protein AlgI
MLFNSIDFAIFLPLIFVLYWFVTNKHLKLQNFLLVLSSYVFYGWWDWRFLSLIMFSTIVDYAVGLRLGKEQSKAKRKTLMMVSILVNLGFLGFFKYYNFFVDNFVAAFTFFGQDIQANSLNIILPVGISFYTFQTLSYTIDVYRRKMKPTKNFIAFAAFVSFFPQLVAGPIERATNLLPQFFKKRCFDYYKAVDGMRQILWGLFKKIVIADNCARFADYIFAHSESMNGSTLFLGVLFFTFQIYGDFSGYSDIAIGTARLFGFNLMRNFAFPYFSRDIAEFWRRWHISLSTWFRDYVYIPLGGSKGSKWMQIRNIFIIFIVSGFWHGANWTFIIWGALNAVFFLPLLLAKRNRKHMEIVARGKGLPGLKEFLGILVTFLLTVFAWVFFRAENLPHAVQYLVGIFTNGTFAAPRFYGMGKALPLAILLVVFLIVEWRGRTGDFAISAVGTKYTRMVRWVLYAGIVFLIGMYMQTQGTPFIYFQF